MSTIKKLHKKANPDGDEPMTYEELALRYMLSSEPELITEAMPNVFRIHTNKKIEYRGSIRILVPQVRRRKPNIVPHADWGDAGLVNTRTKLDWSRTGTDHRQVDGHYYKNDGYLDIQIMKVTDILEFVQEYGEHYVQQTDYQHFLPTLGRSWQ